MKKLIIPPKRAGVCKIILYATSHFTVILAKIDYIIKSQIARLVQSPAYGNMHLKSGRVSKTIIESLSDY